MVNEDNIKEDISDILLAHLNPFDIGRDYTDLMAQEIIEMLKMRECDC